MATTAGMKGGGFYDAHSNEQRAAIDAFLPWLKSAVADLPFDSEAGAPITLLDIGSAEGANAIYVMRELIACIRDKTELPVSVYFSDLATNDFNSLFNKLFPQSDLPLFGDDIYPAAIAGSAFQRIFPASGLHVVTTFNAIGFLECIPAGATLPNFILPMPPGASRDGIAVSDADQIPFREQAATDLRAFYAARAAEMISGGKLLVQVFGRNEAFSTTNGIYDVLSDSILDLIEAGVLTRDYYDQLIFPIYSRTLDELASPLEDDSNIARAFRVEKSSRTKIAAPFNVAFQETGNVRSWSSSYANFLRAFTEPTVLAALPNDSPKVEIIDNIYSTVEERLAADPDRYQFHYISIGVLLTRK